MKAAILGSGLIGRSWAMVFARGGHDVLLWDQDEAQVERALSHIAITLPAMAADRRETLYAGWRRAVRRTLSDTGQDP